MESPDTATKSSVYSPVMENYGCLKCTVNCEDEIDHVFYFPVAFPMFFFFFNRLCNLLDQSLSHTYQSKCVHANTLYTNIFFLFSSPIILDYNWLISGEYRQIIWNPSGLELWFAR